VRFTVFDKNNTPGINTHRFTALFEDAAGDLWLGTESGNVTRYQHGQFRSWATNQGSPIEGFTQDFHRGWAARISKKATATVRGRNPCKIRSA
jgi:Two component regulator propeller